MQGVAKCIPLLPLPTRAGDVAQQAIPTLIAEAPPGKAKPQREALPGGSKREAKALLRMSRCQVHHRPLTSPPA